jgi:hypothetical protein
MGRICHLDYLCMPGGIFLTANLSELRTREVLHSPGPTGGAGQHFSSLDCACTKMPHLELPRTRVSKGTRTGRRGISGGADLEGVGPAGAVMGDGGARSLAFYRLQTNVSSGTKKGRDPVGPRPGRLASPLPSLPA